MDPNVKRFRKMAGRTRRARAPARLPSGRSIAPMAPPSWIAQPSQRQVQAAVNSVKKRNAHFVDLAAAAYVLDTTGSITLLATIAQGVSDSQRVGKKAAYKSVQVRGSVASGTTATLNDVSLLIVYDREPTGALPNITDILNTANSRSFNNDTNSDRFKIVRRIDKVLIGNSTTPATGVESFNLDEYIDLKGMPIQFGNAGTGAIGDIKKGALYLVTVGNIAAGTAAASATLGFRTRFFDTEG